MFSYLATVQAITDEGVYARGIKLYLEGKVVKEQELSLDYWRLYEVISTHQQNIVKIPLLHFALSQKKYYLAGKALQETASCTCDYFQEYGTCKHIVAVCAKLEQEWNPVVKKEAMGEVDSILDSLFAVEQEKEEREVIIALNYALTTGSISSVQLSQRLLAFSRWIHNLKLSSVSDWSGKGFEEHTAGILKKIQEMVLKIVGNYTAEKRLVSIISQPTLVEAGGANWLQFWYKHIQNLDSQRQQELWVKLWQAHLIGSTKYIRAEFAFLYSGLTDEMKNTLLEIFQKQYTLQREYWLEFVFFAHITQWVLTHAKELDPSYLLLAMEFFPEYREEWEIELQNYFQTWTEFLPTGQYKEFVELLRKWRKFGTSEYLKNTFEYVKTIHRKKYSLLKLIRELE